MIFDPSQPTIEEINVHDNPGNARNAKVADSVVPFPDPNRMTS
jgi:hypothetical protein